MEKMVTPALKRAMQSKTGYEREIKIEGEGSNDWDQEEESTVGSVGFRSWFAPRIDFRVGKNSARFQGKEGYGVKGGIVDLFDGAVADLSGARLTGKKGKNKQDVWAEGYGGKLVLIPKDFDSAVVFLLDQIVVEPDHGVVGISSTIVSLSHTAGRFRVEARGALLQGKQIQLIEPVKKNEERETELSSVVLHEGKSEITELNREEQRQNLPIHAQPQVVSSHEEAEALAGKDEESKVSETEALKPSDLEQTETEEEIFISEKEAWDFSSERDIWSANAGEDAALGFSKTFDAFVAPIVPGVAFSITLKPEASIGLSFNKGAENVKVDKDSNTGTLFVGAALRGSLSLTLGAGIDVGLLYLISAYGSINAMACLGGSGDANALADVKLCIPILKERGSIGMNPNEKITAEFNAGLALTGSISADIGVKSSLFAWEKSLFEYTFKTWNLAELSFSASMTRKYAPTTPFYKGWEVEEKGWSANAFKKSFLDKHNPQNHFALLEQQHKKSVSFVEQAQKSYEEALAFLELIKNPGDGNIAAITKDKGDGTADDFLSRLLVISNALNLSSINSKNALEQLDHELKTCMKSKSLKKALAFEAKRTEKHGERIEELKAWQSSDTKKDFKKKFQKHFSVTSGYQEYVKQEAMKKVMTPENIKEYEQKRLEERKLKHTKRIEKLKLYMEKDSSGQGKTDSQVREYYENELGANRQRKHLSTLAEVETIITYEKEHLEADQKKHSDRLNDLREKEANLGITDECAANAEFSNFYFNVIGASAMRKVLAKYANPKEMLDYEDNRLKEKADKSRLALLMGWRKSLPSEKDFEATDPKNFKRQNTELKDSKIKYKTRTVEDLHKYETERQSDLEKNSYWKKMQDTSLSQEDIDKFGKDDKVKHTYTQWIKDHSDLAIQSLSLDSLIRYEGKKSKEESEGEMKHKTRLQDYQAQKKQLESIEKEERSKVERDRVMLNLTREKGKESGVMKELKAGHLFDKNIMEKSEKDWLEKVNKGYQARLDFLKDFKSPGKNFYRAYIIYEFMVKNDSFLKKAIKEREIGEEDFQSYAANMADELDMAARLRYEEFCMSEKVTSNIKQWKGSKKQKIESGTMEEDPLKYADHLTRYDTLKSLYDEQEPAEDVKYQKMLDAYKQMGGGEGFEKELKAKGDQIITPKAIIRYEEDRKIEVGSKHQKRIDYLNAHKDQDYEKVLAGYEALARSDGMEISDRIKAKLNTYFTVGKTGFEKSMNIERMTADNILHYEEKRNEEVSSKSRLRLNLIESDKSDEEKIEDYLKAGGGQGFYRKNKERIDAEKEKLNSVSDDELCENVLKYEKERHDYYSKKYAESQKILDDIKESKKNMKEQITDTNKKIEELSAMQNKPGELLDRLRAINLGTTYQIMENEEKLIQKSEAEQVIERGIDMSQEMQQIIVFMEDEEEGE